MPRWDDDRDLDPEEPKPLADDWCPTCGESQAEHSKEQEDCCFLSFWQTNKAIDERFKLQRKEILEIKPVDESHSWYSRAPMATCLK